MPAPKPNTRAQPISADGSPSLSVVAIGGIVVFFLAALLKAYVAAHPPNLPRLGTLADYPTSGLTAARLAPWVLWVPLALLVWRMAPAIDARMRRPVRILFVHAVSSFVVAAVHVLATVAVNMWILEAEPSLAMFGLRLHGWFSTLFDWEVLSYWAILAGAYAYLFAMRSRDRERQTAELRSRLNDERLQSLLLQLNPHFLFNALNAVTGLIYNGQRDAAVATITRLAELLRMTLQEQLPQEIPLSTELALLRKYVEIETVRFGNRLTVQIDVPRELQGAFVPTLLLQPLVENAIRHGVGRVAGPGEVRITAARDDGAIVLNVWDSGPGVSREASGRSARNGIGISNTNERLSRLYGRSGRLEMSGSQSTGYLVRVSLPFHDESESHSTESI